MTNSQAFVEAQSLFPGGVNSPVRAFKAIGREPVFFHKAQGSRAWDIEGREYIDYCQSWGALILGHAHPRVLERVSQRMSLGTSFGAPSLAENNLGKKILGAFGSMDKLRFVSSGTEGVMSALRVARAFTGRDLILKFDGGYHGHSDGLLVKAGSALAEQGRPSSDGIPAMITRGTLSVPYNDLEGVKKAFALHGKNIAAVILEPAAANMGLILPGEGFLEGLREITQQWESLLIFDEVITGFRLSPGGAQELYGVEPDLTTLGKIIGGGFPVGAFGGRREIMDLIAPLGSVYQAGTLSGNPVAMEAGLSTLEELEALGGQKHIHDLGHDFLLELGKLASSYGLSLASAGSLFTLFFRPTVPQNFQQTLECDEIYFARVYRHLLKEGVYLSPSPFEAHFISAAHSPGDLEKTLKAVDRALAAEGERG